MQIIWNSAPGNSTVQGFLEQTQVVKKLYPWFRCSGMVHSDD